MSITLVIQSLQNICHYKLKFSSVKCYFIHCTTLSLCISQITTDWNLGLSLGSATDIWCGLRQVMCFGTFVSIKLMSDTKVMATAPESWASVHYMEFNVFPLTRWWEVHFSRFPYAFQHIYIVTFRSWSVVKIMLLIYSNVFYVLLWCNMHLWYFKTLQSLSFIFLASLNNFYCFSFLEELMH